MDDLLEDHGVHVLPEHVQQEPVAHLGLLDYYVDALLLDEPEADVEEVGPHPRGDDDDEAVEDHHSGQHCQQQEVEPQEDVDLLIDNVDGQDAEGVVALNVSGRTKLVEGALGHPREDVDDRVYTILLVAQGKGNDLDAEGEESSVEEAVHQKELAWKKLGRRGGEEDWEDEEKRGGGTGGGKVGSD